MRVLSQSKNTILQLSLVSLVVLSLTACKSIQGNLEVKTDFIATTKNKCSWNPFKRCPSTKLVSIPVGNYQSEISFPSTKEILISLKANTFKESIILVRPSNFDLPKNGPFSLPAEVIKQKFSISGLTQTSNFTTEPRRGYEDCQYYVRDWVCYPDSQGRPSCSWQNVSVWGRRSVEYYERITRTQLTANLQEQRAIIASFTGVKDQTEKIYNYQGRCY